jgi:hypothetical protein
MLRRYQTDEELLMFKSKWDSYLQFMDRFHRSVAMNKYNGIDGNGYQPIHRPIAGKTPHPPKSDYVRKGPQEKEIDRLNELLSLSMNEADKYSQLWLSVVDKNTANAALADERGRRLEKLWREAHSFRSNPAEFEAWFNEDGSLKEDK